MVHKPDNLLVIDITFKVGTTNNGPSTLNVNELGPVVIKQYDGSDTIATELTAGRLIEVQHTGSYFVLMNSHERVLTDVVLAKTAAETAKDLAETAETNAAASAVESADSANQSGTNATAAQASADQAGSAAEDALNAIITVSTSGPTGGTDGDVWFKVSS